LRAADTAPRQHPFEKAVPFDDAVPRRARGVRRHKEIDQVLPDQVDGDRRLRQAVVFGISGGMDKIPKKLMA